MSTSEYIMSMVRPVQILSSTLFFLPGAILATLTDPETRSSTTGFRQRWFARFWSWFGPLAKESHQHIVCPLLESASGTVLDIGTGAGHWLDAYDTSKITKIVSCETNRDHHPALLKSARDAGLQDRFEIAALPVEQLVAAGLADAASFDCVVTINVLCSADNQETVGRAGYELLRPGGRWLLYEHVKAHNRSEVINRWQGLLNLVWPYFLGGCSLCRETAKTLRAAGPWSRDTLRHDESEPPYSVIPSIVGELEK